MYSEMLMEICPPLGVVSGIDIPSQAPALTMTLKYPKAPSIHESQGRMTSQHVFFKVLCPYTARLPACDDVIVIS